MKLSQQHIEQLYTFTRKHYVEYYDVQAELVDHLANDIETIWKEDKHLTFEQARDKAFKKFGVFGFLDVVQAKEWQMTKKYIKLTFQFAKEWFKLPKIILTLLLLFGFYKIQEFEIGYTFYYTFFILILLIQLVVMIINARKLKVKQTKTGKKWLFENVIFVNGIGNILVFSLWFYDFPFDNLQEFLLMSDFTRVLATLLITVLTLFGYIILIEIPKKANALLLETYPEYEIV